MNIIPEIELVEAAEQNIKRYAYELFIRAFPDIKDGLKPIHRRILWILYKEKVYNFVKVASLVGSTLKYHPHGDLAVKDTIVRMAQPWVMNNPYIEIQGNLGSQAGDEAAAGRYIEAKCSEFTKKVIFDDLDLVSVNYTDNYDFNVNLRLPEYMPTRLPLVLLNGASGIGEAYKCDLPPHNLNDVVDLCIKYINNKNIKNFDFVEGLFPDFPTGGEILNGAEIERYYKYGEPATIQLRGKATLDTETNTIILTEFPYSVDINDISEKITKLVKEGNMILSGIENIQDNNDYGDESEEVEVGKTNKKLTTTYEYICKKDANMLEILNEMYKTTNFKKTIPLNLMVSENGKPMYVTILDIVKYWYSIRQDFKQRKHSNAIAQIYPVKHVYEGILKVYDIMDDVIQTIRTNTEDKDSLIKTLHDKFGLTLVQAKGIYEMNVGSLSKFGKEDLLNKIEKCNKEIQENEIALTRIDEIIIEELLEVKKLFGVPRRTKINMEVEEFVSKLPVIHRGSLLYSLGSIGLYDTNGVKNSRTILLGLKPVKVLNKNVREIIGGKQLYAPPIGFIVCYSNGTINRIDASVFKVANVWYDLQLEKDVTVTCATPIYHEDDTLVAISGNDFKLKQFNASEVNGKRALNCGETITNIIAYNENDPNQMNNLLIATEDCHYSMIPLSDVPIVSRSASGVKSAYSDYKYEDGKGIRGKLFMRVCSDEAYDTEMVMISTYDAYDKQNYMTNIPLLSLRVGNRTNKPKKLELPQDHIITSISIMDTGIKDSVVCMIGKSSTSTLSINNFKKPDSFKKIFLTVTSSTQI